jgi:hypothetical protein
MKEPGHLLFLLLVATSFTIFFVGKSFFSWFGPKWFKTKTFVVRFIISPILFLYCFLFNLDNMDVKWVLAAILTLGFVDRFAAWADRNVPDSHPRKYR